DTRRQATMKLIGLKGVYGLPDGVAAKFSSNNGKPHQGGTCFGDSGGPIFVQGTRIIVAVTSFGMDPNCASGGGGYRLDQSDDLDWFADFGITP
ncbi:MAG TPA: trypsin-like serine protease, partial [Nocardioidaceae bacterium]|nr:trypsin-like serine protease [Nocardioidaceae bacterium]